MTSNDHIIQLSNICFAYPGRQPVLQDLNFSMERAQRIGLVAPNGSGKTTLFHIIMGLLVPDSGKIKIFGKPVAKEQDFVAETVTAFYTMQDGKIVEDPEHHPHYHKHAHPLGKQPHEH